MAEKTALEWREQGIAHRQRNEPEKAAEYFEAALEIDDDPALVALLAETWLDRGDLNQAVGYYALAVQESPAEITYKERLLELAGGLTFLQYNETMAGLTLDCLRTPGLDCSRAQILWFTLLVLRPGFRFVCTVSPRTGQAYFDEKAFGKMKSWELLLEPYFLEGLRQIVIYHSIFEEFLTYLRRALLAGPGKKLDRAGCTMLSAALSQYCFDTEHIFDVSSEEREKVEILRQSLETEESVMSDALSVALFACYAPLYRLKSAARIRDLHAGNPVVAAMIRAQIEEPLVLQEAARNVEAITDIAEPVSLQVREQYEEFPYPRWKAFSKRIYSEEVEGPLRGQAAKILIAGCGTGREAVELATVFSDAEILAVDLSRISLAYAIEATKKHRVDRVSFRQADILQLESLGETFDYISSGGVLHHMRDPLEGWKVLAGLLKPGGIMRVGLYSKTARRILTEARQTIREKGYDATAEGMRSFRRDASKLLDSEKVQHIANYGDYYHLSMLRDMLFHVQEHCFDLEEIEAAVRDFGLSFVRFNLPPTVLAFYAKQYPDDPQGVKLSHWQRFEEGNPDTFRNMYQFWCRKE